MAARVPEADAKPGGAALGIRPEGGPPAIKNNAAGVLGLAGADSALHES
jgi:hypothetical protein